MQPTPQNQYPQQQQPVPQQQYPQAPQVPPAPQQPQTGQPPLPGQAPSPRQNRFKITGKNSDLNSGESVVFQCLTPESVEKYFIWDANLPRPANPAVKGWFRKPGESIPSSNGYTYKVENTQAFSKKDFETLLGVQPNIKRDTSY